MGTASKGRRDYGTGSIFQRQSDGMWIGRIELTADLDGKRRRIQVSAKTEVECKRRLVAKQRDIATKGEGGAKINNRTTINTWAQTWIKAQERDLAANTYATYRGALNKWIVPTIGGKQLASLAPSDLVKVRDAELDAGNKLSSTQQTRRVLVKMLRDAVAEGHTVPPAVFEKKRTRKTTSDEDRDAIPVPHALAIIDQATRLAHGSRWVVAFFQGMRQGESLGLTWDRLTDGRTLKIDRQLDNLPYRDRSNPDAGFRHPVHVKPVHLWRSYHLMPIKSDAGNREIPLLAASKTLLDQWRTEGHPNPYRLVWSRPDGRPINDKDDRYEFRRLQDTADVRHHSGRHYDVHEIRHSTATLLLEAGVDPKVVERIMGHSSITTSRIYQHVSDEFMRSELERAMKSLSLGIGPAGA